MPDPFLEELRRTLRPGPPRERTVTSHDNPLRVTWIPTGFKGRLGITFMPGKKGPSQLQPGVTHDRDLTADVRALKHAGAGHLVNLMETREMLTCGVARLHATLKRAGITYAHLPTRDLGVPADEDADADTLAQAQEAAQRVQRGESVVCVCLGGLGRSGMFAALVLTQLGFKPLTAIGAVRRHRPGAIQTPAQEAYVRHAPAPAIPPR